MRNVLMGAASLLLLYGCDGGNAATSKDPVLRSIVSCITHDTCRDANVLSSTLPNGNRIRTVAIESDTSGDKILFTYGDVGEFGVSFGEDGELMLMDENGDGNVDSVYLPPAVPGGKPQRRGYSLKQGAEYESVQSEYRHALDAAHRTLVLPESR